MLAGYKTLLANGLVIISSIFMFFGMSIPETDIAAISAGVIAVVNIFLRFNTKTPIFKGK